jgi:RNA polymerase sigma-70 factor (ECF subfamily)
MCRIYHKYKDYLLTLATGLLHERADAEDVVQDVFVAFARSAGQFRLTGSLKGYLATCVRNLALDRIRATARRAEGAGPVAPSTESRSPEKSAIESEELARLREAMSRIPYEQRETIVLHVKGGLRFREIARLQGVPLSTSHARYRYGIDKLRSLLNGEVQQ